MQSGKQTLPKVTVKTIRGKMHEDDAADYRVYIDGEDAGWAVKRRNDKRCESAPNLELFLRVNERFEERFQSLIVGALTSKINMEKIGYVPIYIVNKVV